MRRSLTRFARSLVCALVAVVLASACTGLSRSYESEPAAIDDGVPRGLERDQELVDAASTVRAAQAVPPTTTASVSCLSTRLRVAQLLLPLATQPELAGAQAFAADGELGGIGLLGQPDAGSAGALEELQQLSPIPLIAPEAVNGLLVADPRFSDLVFTDASNVEMLESAFLAGTDIAVLGSLAELTPALDHLVMRANEDPAFAALVDNRAARVLAAKDQQSFCASAE